MIEINDVTKRFYDQVALKNISLTIKNGEVIGLLGPNGAGKTTLMKMIAGLYKTSAGTIQPTATTWPAIAYKPERLIYPNHLRVREYLQLVAKLSSISSHEQKSMVQNSLMQVGLFNEANKRIKHCSKGMRQRLGMAQIMLGDPRLLLLDEPTSGLDPTGQKQIIMLIKQLQTQGKTIVISSHQLHEITQICSELVILHEGEIRYQSSMHEAMSLQARTTIQADKHVTAVSSLITSLHTDIRIQGDTITLMNEAMYLRRQVLAILISNGFDIVYLDQQRKTLSEIYVEAISA